MTETFYTQAWMQYCAAAAMQSLRQRTQNVIIIGNYSAVVVVLIIYFPLFKSNAKPAMAIKKGKMIMFHVRTFLLASKTPSRVVYICTHTKKHTACTMGIHATHTISLPITYN